MGRCLPGCSGGISTVHRPQSSINLVFVFSPPPLFISPLYLSVLSGAVAGIVIGVAVFVVIVMGAALVGALLCYRRTRDVSNCFNPLSLCYLFLLSSGEEETQWSNIYCKYNSICYCCVGVAMW